MRNRTPSSSKSSPSFRCSDVGHRVGIGDGRNRAVVGFRFQQQPRILRLAHRPLEREARIAEKGGRRRQNARTARLVEIQATGVVARPQAEGNEFHSLERREIQSVPARLQVFGSWISGNTDSASSGNPPVPADESSRRKASSETIRKVAEAIRAMHRMLRPGR